MAKLKITLKAPDAVYQACNEAAEDWGEKNAIGDDQYCLIKEKRNEFESLCNKWFRYGEYLTVEVDTESETIKVLEV